MEFAQSAPTALQRIGDAEDASLILILSDINMPGMSGLELLPKAKAARPDVPVIMITAYGDAETKRKALENGAEALLTKPIDFAALRGEIETRRRAGGVTARILVVDDEPDLEALVAAEIPPPDPRRRGRASCSRATASRRSPLLAANRDIDMVVSDINMPRMDGLSLLQKLQEAEEQLSTIIVSAYGDMANIRTAMNRGAFDFLTKPIDFADLETTIAKTLRHRRGAARGAAAAVGGGARACLAVALFLAQSGRAARRRRRRRSTSPGSAARSPSLFTDIAGFTTLVETIEPSVLGAAAQRLSRRHDRHRVRA